MKRKEIKVSDESFEFLTKKSKDKSITRIQFLDNLIEHYQELLQKKRFYDTFKPK